ncbi:LOW QUALITY PROTEIN: uncharacterized protein LOC121871043 [Homarus americanus]|uniref:LOW QUALITY PROTEIN: uncharacterized protein LOC121871043 n=1 Tax=Homarus americanus TaxID=6706 RepID=UPI001C46EF66|nr:LOW QUALITY PROTEIN: uncharacterized protein LOC121871043 [Homarus americanus]
MYGGGEKGKVKNEKITRWRIYLSCFSYNIVYRPGKENVAADAFSRMCSSVSATDDLQTLHNNLCHPGVTRMMHFVRSRNLPYFISDVKAMTATCSTCLELKLRFFRSDSGTLIKATQPFERLNMDFKGPLPSKTRNRYLLTIIDEYSRFPFTFPCSDLLTNTVIKCLCSLFSIFGMAAYIHSNRGVLFLSGELEHFLAQRGVASSRTTAYNPQVNRQVERYNGIIWRTVTLALKSRKLPTTHWEDVLVDALHYIRSLLSTATNTTLHEWMFGYQQRSASGRAIPTWLTTQKTVYLKLQVRYSKYDPLVDEVELLDVNPQYASVRFQREGKPQCLCAISHPKVLNQAERHFKTRPALNVFLNKV